MNLRTVVHPLGRIGQQPEQLLTLQDIARILQVKPSWIYDAVEESRLPVVKVGRFLWFRPGDIHAFAERNATGEVRCAGPWCVQTLGRVVDRLRR